MIPSWKWTRKYCFSKIPVNKGVYKTLLLTGILTGTSAAIFETALKIW